MAMMDHAGLYKALVEYLMATAKVLANAGHPEEVFAEYLPLIGCQPDPDADVGDGDPSDQDHEGAAPIPGSWIRINGVSYTATRHGATPPDAQGNVNVSMSEVTVELEVVTPSGRSGGSPAESQNQQQRSAWRHPQAVQTLLRALLAMGSSRQPPVPAADFAVASCVRATVADAHDRAGLTEVTVIQAAFQVG
ncbi:MAG: hypothetical protein ACK5MB_06235 [Phycisphaerales bacterium]|jgi:hypothetical protein